jgi:cytochrome c-type biogenesis protein CcmH/NrfG
MQREPMIYAAAGTVFGFVLGYMVANAGSAPAPRLSTFPSESESAAPVAPPAAANPHMVDADEVRALEALAGREARSVEVRVQLGNTLMDGHRYDDAARWYREALALDPKRPDVIVDLGACLVNGGKAAEGLAEFDRALAIDPGHRNAAFNRGVALVELNRPKDAADAWEVLLARFPNDAQLQALRGRINELRSGKSQ